MQNSKPTRLNLDGATDPRPLAEILRPSSLEEFVGQSHLLCEGRPLHRMISSQKVTSTIFWGPPGVGKTSLARLLAKNANMEWVSTSAVFSGVSTLRKIFDQARSRSTEGISTILFVDEIHRFNRSQQDSFLPYMEDGSITLIGATTENPSFELNSALLSRSQVLVLSNLDKESLETLLNRAETHMGQSLPVTRDARSLLIQNANGDGRVLINMAEQIWLQQPSSPLEPSQMVKTLAQRTVQYDKQGEWHYNLISALHKSVRSSDPDASIYWLARMLNGGEDPRFIARRITRMAVEDIGLSDPQALPQCLAAWECYERLGSPEGELAIAQSVIYLALAPKSNAVYKAFKSAIVDAKNTSKMSPPKHLLNAPTKMMKNIGYGKGYQYDHDSEDGFSGQNCFPEDMQRVSYFQPVERGFERDLNKRLHYFSKLRKQRKI